MALVDSPRGKKLVTSPTSKSIDFCGARGEISCLTGDLATGGGGMGKLTALVDSPGGKKLVTSPKSRAAVFFIT